MKILFKKVRVFSGFFLIFLLSLNCSSQEFKFEEVSKFTNFNLGFGARALGMGGAFISIADDSTASSWNPAGIAQLIKPEFSMSTSYTNYTQEYPDYSYTYYYSSYYYTLTRSSYERKNSGFNFDFLSIVFPFKLGDFNSAIQLSYQRNINLSVDSEYKVNSSRNYYRYNSFYPYSYYNYNHQIKLSAKGGFDSFTFSLATSIPPYLYFGFCVNNWFSKQANSSEQKSSVSGTYQYTYGWDSKTEYKFSGINFGFGILLKISNFSAGLVFKTPFTSKVEYTEKEKYHDSNGAWINRNYSGDWKIKWPYNFGIGFSFRPIDRFTVAMDFIRANWSKARYIDYKWSYTSIDSWGNTYYYDVYESELTFPGGSKDLKSQKDVSQVRFGLEYLIFAGSNTIPLRFGFFTDPQPTNDDASKQIKLYGITFGGGISIGDILLDFAYVNQRGKLNILSGINTYKETPVNIHTFFFSLIYRTRLL
jgi:hypothetical protein